MAEEKTELAVVENNDALYLITKAEIDIQISTAKAFPRSLKKFMDKAISMATLSEEIAESCTYALPRKKKNEETGTWENVALEGPSVRLAEIICSCYGNIRSGSRIIDNDGKTVTSQGVCHDLETNNARTVEVKRKITGKDGKTFSEDMQVVTGNAAGAIAFRNAVFSVVPAALVEPVWEAAKKVAKGTAETLVKRRDKAVAWFREQKVKDEQICAALEIKAIEDIDLEKLATLTSMRAALKNGETTVKDLFETNSELSLEDLQELFEMKKEHLTAPEITNAENLLKAGGKSNLKKVQELLKSK